MMSFWGVAVNTFMVIIGALLGVALKTKLTKRINDALMIGIGACVIYIGVDGMLKGQNVLLTVLSVAFGGLIGTLVRLDDGIHRLGNRLESHFKGKQGGVSQGFVTGTLIFCVGSMTVVGSLNSGVLGDNQMLYTKSLMDLITAAMLATTMGIGVCLSAVSVLLFQGSITLLAGVLAPVLNDFCVAQITCVGSVVILLLGFNLLGLSKFKVADYLPSIVIAPILCYSYNWILSLGLF